MKPKILNALLIVTSLLGYLEWSGDSHTFLFQAEAEILHKLFTNPSSVVHPFILLPLIGQILLLGFMFIIGLISLNYKIIISTISFLVVAVLTIINLRKLK